MFDNVSGLEVNAAIQIAGVKVGKVVGITLSQKNERARVTMQIDDDVVIHDEATASIKTSGLIGEKYVSISTAGGDPLNDGAVITDTEPAFVLEDAIGQLVNSSAGKVARPAQKKPQKRTAP